jgi:16S rRNA (cytosine1402-N4)-methyltransferase
LGIDQDLDAVNNAKTRLAPYGDGVRIFHGNFIQLPEFMSQLEIDGLDGILIDLGLSQHQLEASGRGFSFQRQEPLDMRMNTEEATTAAHLVNALSRAELERIFKEYGEERFGRRIADNIVTARQSQPIHSSSHLADLVSASIPQKTARSQKIHPATRVFMALRIAVNRELERLEAFLEMAVGLLHPKGRLCALSFHSLEDRIVKHFFRQKARGCDCPPDFPKCVCNRKALLRIITKRVIRPTQAEISQNPMARSTRLRAAEKI